MPDPNDRDLLLGVLAVRMGFIDRPALSAAMEEWTKEPGRPLGAVLVAAGAIGDGERAALEMAVEAQLGKHGSARQSIAAMLSESPASAAASTPAASLLPTDASAPADSSKPAQSSKAADPLVEADRLLKDPLASRSAPGSHSHFSTMAVARDETAPDTAVEPPDRTQAERGRFRIVRWLAGGGLGDVFLARDEELGREVALKEIREKYADHTDLRARFTLEAEITGNLEHPGIVPVYGKGQDAAGRPYYAMRFIRGESLLAAIQRFHEQGGHGGEAGRQNLALRKLLARFVDVCNAVAYAHSRGVIHRDIKPDNVMLGPYGETLVVDWGLAKLVQKAEPPPSPEPEPTRSTLHPMGEGSPTPTQIGAVVGTLAYMSPEQAAGLVDQLTPASDIYSLGGTLFTLLCGHAPFEGVKSDELRHGIIMGKHATPRQLDARVPPALEAICLRAMAIDPARRYGSARELAEEVERWLADEPVAAWREPFRVRAQRWMRQHRMLVSGAMAGVLVAAVSLAVGVVLLSAANERERAAKVLAEENEEEAREAKLLADQNAEAAEKAKRLAEENADAAEKARRLAETNAETARKNFDMAREAVDKYLTRVGEDPRLKAHDLESLRRDLLETARDFYERFIEEHPDEPELQAAAGWAHYRLAWITADIGSRQRAIELLHRAAAIFVPLADRHPNESDYQLGLLKSRVALADGYAAVSRPDEAAKALESVPKRIDKLPAPIREAAESRAQVAYALSVGALLHASQKRFTEAEAACREAIAIREQLVKEHPDVAEYRCHLGRNKMALGMLCRALARNEEGEKLLGEAVEICQTMVNKYPNVAEYERDLARALDVMIALLVEKGGAKPDIEKSYKASLAYRENLARKHPDMTVYRVEAARANFDLGFYYWKAARLKEAVESFQAARKYYERLAAERGEVPDYRDMLGSTLNNLGLIQAALGQHDEVPALAKEAIAIRRKLSDEYPDNFVYWGNLGSSQRNYGDWLWGRNRVEDSEGPYREAAETYDALVRRHPDDASYAGQLAALYNRLGFVALETGRLKDVQDWCLKAKSFWEARPASVRDAPQGKTVLRDAHWGAAEALSRLGQHERAAAEWDLAYSYDPDATHWLLRAPRALSLARAGDHARAAAEAKELLPLRKFVGLDLYRLAVAYALASKSVAADASLDAARRKQLAEEYASAALDALRQCREAGFFGDKRRVEQLEKEEAFEELRAREEFKKLLSNN